MVEEKSIAKRHAEAKRDNSLTWQSVLLASVMLVTLIWGSNWTIGVTLVIAVVVEFRPEWLAEQDDHNTSGSFDLFAYGVGLFFIEFMDWLIRYKDEIPFRDVFFPIADPPYDLRGIFFGWLFVFMGAARKIRQFVDDDPKLDS